MRFRSLVTKVGGSTGLLLVLLPAHAGLVELDFSSELHRSTGQFTTEYVTSIDGFLTFDPTAPLISSTDGGIGRGSSRAPLSSLEFRAFGSTFKNTGGQVGQVITESDTSYCMVDSIACYRDIVKFWVWDPQPTPMMGVAVTGFSLEIFGGHDMLENGDQQPFDLSFFSRAKYARVMLTKEGGAQGLLVGSPEQANVTPYVASIPEPNTAALTALALMAVALGSSSRRRLLPVVGSANVAPVR